MSRGVPVGKDNLPHVELTRAIALSMTADDTAALIRRAEFACDEGLVDDVLRRGNAPANTIADETLRTVRTAATR